MGPGTHEPWQSHHFYNSWWLYHFFTDKTRTISSQFSPPHTQDLQPTTSTAQTPIFSFCPLTEGEVSKLLLSGHPTTCPLDPIPSHLLQAISPALLPALTHIINTSLLTGIFPTAFKQARVTPLLKKPTLNTYLIENYRPLSLSPSIHSENTQSHNELSSTISHCFFHKTTNWTLNSQDSGVAIQLRLRYSQSLKPCELQKLIPIHQSSFCWIYLPLLTL